MRKNKILAFLCVAILITAAFGINTAAVEEYKHYYGVLHAHTGNSDG